MRHRRLQARRHEGRLVPGNHGADRHRRRRRLTFLREQIATRHKDNRDDAVWHHDKRAEIVEKAVTFGSAMYPVNHPDHEKWKADMANTYFLLRLYCSLETAGAFKSVSDGLVLVVESGRTDQRILLIQGEGNMYLQAMGRHDSA